MSRIGNAPITVPEGVEINISAENMVSVKGKLGELKENVNPSIKVEYNDGIVSLSRSSDEKESQLIILWKLILEKVNTSLFVFDCWCRYYAAGADMDATYGAYVAAERDIVPSEYQWAY